MAASIDNDGGTLIKLIPTFKNEVKKDFNIVSVQIDVPSPNITMIFGFLYDPGGRIWGSVSVSTKEITFLKSIGDVIVELKNWGSDLDRF